MLTFEQKKNMAKGGTFYKPISTPRNAPLNRGFWYIGPSLSGKYLVAQVASLRDIATPQVTLNCSINTTVQKTYAELVTEGYISYVPHKCQPDDQVYLNGIAITKEQSVIAALSLAGVAGGDAVFYWDCLLKNSTNATEKVLCAGEFTVTGGVTIL